MLVKQTHKCFYFAGESLRTEERMRKGRSRERGRVKEERKQDHGQNLRMVATHFFLILCLL